MSEPTPVIPTPSPSNTTPRPPESTSVFDLLPGLYEVPHSVVSIDRTTRQPTENQYIAQLSSIYATLFKFDIPNTHVGKTCNLVFRLPYESHESWSPYNLIAPGGMNVLKLKDPNSIVDSVPVGHIDKVSSAQDYFLSSAPCEAGGAVVYQAESFGGLEMQFFQMEIPAVGFFVTVSG